MGVRWGVETKNHFMGGMDIFWNHAFQIWYMGIVSFTYYMMRMNCKKACLFTLFGF